MIAETRSGASLGLLEHTLGTLAARFAEAGYEPVAPGHLFPAERLLDLYGEDMRGRAFLFPGGGGGEELCLRPDFTLPVVLYHGSRGWDRAAAYSYQGAVFRRQPDDPGRPAEYLQAGIESLGREDGPETEAEIFALVLNALEKIGVDGVDIATGDLSIAFALLDAVEMPERRRALLKRHFWRPARFHALIDAFAGPAAPASGLRRALLDAVGNEDAITALALDAGEPLGLRETSEIATRAAGLAAAEGEPPLARETADLIETVLEVASPAPQALDRLRALASEAAIDLSGALDRFAARLDALARAGVEVDRLPFDADFGRKLEYYDGFVFEIAQPEAAHLPPLAGGGRYDSMTPRLGAPNPVPAVGAMIRPEAALAAAGQRR